MAQFCVFFFKQKTAYEMRISDWSSDVALPICAAAVARILGRHEPVYGINTGFGKLASVRIGDDELEMLQRNIVLSHAAGVGDPMPLPVVRLMLALKLASLAQGAPPAPRHRRSDEHTSELQSLMRNSYAVSCLKKKTKYSK